MMRMRGRTMVLLLWVLIFFSPVVFAEDQVKLPVPITRQATYYSCGAAALMSLLYYWKVYDGTETDLYPLTQTNPDTGTSPSGIIETAEAYGLEASLLEHLEVSDLRQALFRGDTLILDIQAWPLERPEVPWEEVWDEGHYVVLVGLDKNNVYVMDPSIGTSYGYIPIEEFLSRWHDYEIIDGKERPYYHSAISIRGENPVGKFPGRFIKVE